MFSMYSQYEYSLCLEGRAGMLFDDEDYERMHFDGGEFCVDCYHRKKHWTEGLADILGAVAWPAAFVAGTYLSSDAYKQSNKYWAKAFGSGNRACTRRFNSYLDYTVTMGASPVTPRGARHVAS